MSYANRCRASAERLTSVLKDLDVEEKYLRFDGKIELPKRISVPTQSDSKFQAEQALGDWAENTLKNSINLRSSHVTAISYGDNSKVFAEDDAFKQAYKTGIIETFTYGKRADLLVVPRTDGTPADITDLDHEQRENFVRSSLGALEVRSSRMTARVYRDYQKSRAAEKKRPKFLEPNFTLKVEDLVKVFLWISLNDKPQSYVQVFFDEVHAIGFATMLEYIVSGEKLVVEKHDRSDKTTIMIPISVGGQVGSITDMPSFSVVHNILKSGRHDIFAKPDGGSMEIDVDQIIRSFE